jgi:hypothetical protein
MSSSKSLLAIASLLFANATFAAADIDASRLSETAVEINDVSQSGAAGKSFIAGTIIDAPIAKL